MNGTFLTPSSTPFLPAEPADIESILFVGVFLAFILRLFCGCIEELIIQVCCGKCIERTRAEAEALLDAYVAPSYIGFDAPLTTHKLCNNTFISWERGKFLRGFSDVGALFVGTFTVLFLHLSQPAFYYYSLWVYYLNIDSTQKYLGIAVAIREAIYVLLILYGLYHKPTFLLVDMIAMWNNEQRNFWMFVLAPEKFVFKAVIDSSNCSFKTACCDCARVIFFIVLVLLDVCGIAALITACITGFVFPPLMVGYSVTCIAALFTLKSCVIIEVFYVFNLCD